MGDEEDAPLARGEVEPDAAHDRSGSEVEAPLDLGCGAGERRPAERRWQGREVDAQPRRGGLRSRVPLPPAVGELGEAQTQGVVMAQQGGERSLGGGGRERTPDGEQHGVVEVPRRERLRGEEPALDGGEGNVAGHRLLSRRDHRGGAGDRRQPGDGRLLEQLPRGDVAARPRGARDDLDRQDRVTAESEEVIVNADAVEPQHLGPDPGEQLFGRRSRRREPLLAAGSLRVRRALRQSLAVDLAVRG